MGQAGFGVRPSGIYIDKNDTLYPTSTSAAEGVAADARGNLYGAEVGPKDVKRYVKK